MRGRLITGPVRPLARTLTLAGGWGLTHPQAGPALAEDIGADPEEGAFDPPRTSFFNFAPPPVTAPELQLLVRGGRGILWKELLMSRTAIAACLVGAFFAGLLAFRAGTRPRPADQPAAQAAARVAAPPVAAPAVAAPVPEPEPAPVVAAPQPEPVTPPKAAAVEHPRAETIRRATAALPRAARSRPAVIPPRPARKPQSPAAAKEEWVDPFSNGSWVDLPSKD